MGHIEDKVWSAKTLTCGTASELCQTLPKEDGSDYLNVQGVCRRFQVFQGNPAETDPTTLALNGSGRCMI